ncbi:MAG TPA: PCRF domain-containing protein, partial [Candidatus Limnocylindrales bacterium]|nr:PCRF domain-containing protein [Candidatus Limnocylindrales bacterium]
MAKKTLYEKLDQLEARYEEMTAQLSSPEVLADSARIQKLAKMHSELAEIVKKYRLWKQIDQGQREAKE